MARPIVLGNGELHVGLNNYGLVHDFYFPYVGLENHAAGKSLRHHIGIWVDGSVTWLDDKGWSFSFTYPHNGLIGHTIAVHEKIGIRLEFDDAVDSEFSAFMRSIHVINLSSAEREVRLFMHQAFVIGDSRSNTDTAQYLPDANAILHYRGRRAFVISMRANDEWFDQHAIGLFDIEGREGTYRDADDGELSMGNVEHGRVDSTLRKSLRIGSHDSVRVEYWVACGTSIREALYIHKQVSKHSVSHRLTKTTAWWNKWLAPALKKSESLPEEYRRSFVTSVMIIKSQIDKRGAVIASTDTAMLNYSRDTYAYCWPRDGANTVWPLIRLGYYDEAYQFFAFCRRALHPAGYLMHKYRADGALGSSWHPYFHEDGSTAAPIQEDETALTLFVFSQLYHEHPDKNLFKEFYMPMVVPMADFLSNFVDRSTGLPRPSYDLWEERYSTFTYTTAVTYAALLAASRLADVADDDEHAVRWRSSAEDIRAASQRLYDADRGTFLKSVHMQKDGTTDVDGTVDVSSFYGCFMFGLFPLDSNELTTAAATLKKTFSFGTNGFGLPRYEHDTYRRNDEKSLGNWWPLVSLWMAQYSLEIGEEAVAHDILRWVISLETESGILPEQIDPLTKNAVSVSPLTWSHAELVSTLLDLSEEKS